MVILEKIPNHSCLPYLVTRIEQIQHTIKIGVADPHHFADPDPDPAFYLNVDPNPAFNFNADPDPVSLQSDGLSIQASIVIVHNPPGTVLI